MTLRILLFLAAATLAPLSAQVSHVQVNATIIALPEADILPKMLTGQFTDDEALFDYAKAQVETGSGRIEAVAKISTPSGQRAKFENTDRITMPNTFELTKNEPSKIAMSDYYSMSVGTTLEVDPTITPDHQIQLNVAFEHHLSRPTMTKFSTSLLEPAASGKSFIEQPVPYLEKTTQALQLQSGGTRLAASLRPLEKRGGLQECHLVFMTATILPAIEPAKKAVPIENQTSLHFVAIEAPTLTVFKETVERGSAPIAEDGALLRRMLDYVSQNEAEIVAHNLVGASNGQRVKTEMARQNISPTEFQIVEPDRVVPTAFEIWPSGCTFEADPHLSSSPTPMLNLNIAPHVDGPMRWRRQHFALLDLNKTGSVVQPEIDIAKITTACHVAANGTHTLLIGSMPSASAGKQQLWFIQAKSQNAKPPPPDNPNRNTTTKPLVEIAVTAFALSASEAVPLLMTRTTSDSELFESLVDRAKREELRVFLQSSLSTRTGQRARIVSATQLVGPTSYDFFGEKGAIAGPAAFENREVGYVFEADPMISRDRKEIELNFSLNLSLAPAVFHPAPVDPNTDTATIQSRQDHPLELHTSLTSPPDIPVLAAAMYPNGDAAALAGVPSDTTILFFVQTKLKTP